MTLDDIEQNIGKWVLYCCNPNDLPETDDVPVFGFGIIIGIKEDTKYQIILDITHVCSREQDFEFVADEIKFIIPDKDSKIFKLLI